MPALPVTVLSGFLGAGKTTILNHLLRHPGGRKLAVLVNDLAEVNLDGLKLKSGRTRLAIRAPESGRQRHGFTERQLDSVFADVRADRQQTKSLESKSLESKSLESKSLESKSLESKSLESTPSEIAAPRVAGPSGTDTAHHLASSSERARADEATADGVIELHNGCICCTLREDFIREVSRLARHGEFDALIVEATGVAEPLPVAMAFDMTDEDGRVLGSVAEIDSMVTVVDAANFLADWDKAEELGNLGLSIDGADNRTIADLLAEQVEYANHLVINKTDLVTAADLIRLEQLLGCLNPDARITKTMFGLVDPEQFLSTGLFELRDAERDERSVSREDSDQRTGASSQRAPAASQAARPRLEHTANVFASERLHDTISITSFVYRARRPFHPERLWAYLAESWPGVLRSKGLFWLASRMNDSGLWSQAGKACSQQSAGRWWSSVPDDLWPDDDTLRASILGEFRGPFGDRRQEIVIIGHELHRPAIRARLDACLLDSSEMRLGPMGWRQLRDPFPPWQPDFEDETEILVPLLNRETPSA